MENEIKKFDVNEAMLNVKDRIKDAFVSLIPDEQWNVINPYEMFPKRIRKVSFWNGLLKGYALDYK